MGFKINTNRTGLAAIGIDGEWYYGKIQQHQGGFAMVWLTEEKDFVVICSNEECHGCRPCTCGSTEEEAVANWNNRQGFDNQADINIVLRKLEYLRETIHIGKKRSVALHYTWQIEKILSELYKRL